MGMLRRKRTTRTQKLLKGAGIAAGSIGAAALGWIGYSALAIDHKRRLRSAIDAPINSFRTRNAGTVSYYVDRGGDGAPVVLLHSINAAASSYEMRPLFDHFRGKRPVYALDLPGFGFSDRHAREYSPALYARVIVEFLESEVGAKADVIALSLTGEFAARAAVERPDRFRSLALISPTGFSADAARRENDTAYNAMSFPLWSQAFYDLLVSPPSIRYYLNKSFEGQADSGLAEYSYDTAHRPNARVAPLQFVAGKLFTPDVYSKFYERLEVPALALYDRDAYVTFERVDEISRAHPNWRAERIAGTRGLPHFERREATVQALERFWEGVNTEASRPAAV
ncbi:MAG TPA: alpha/beta fold hydrolase [Bryobacteraceae bacterium]|nr:alpha/beta fold hydrolase [Bryobacteraceae bacterium]